MWLTHTDTTVLLAVSRFVAGFYSQMTFVVPSKQLQTGLLTYLLTYKAIADANAYI